MKYYGQLYANKIYNLDEMDKFPERLKLQKLIQGEIENENKLITYKEIELIIKKKSTNKNHSFACRYSVVPAPRIAFIMLIIW